MQINPSSFNHNLVLGDTASEQKTLKKAKDILVKDNRLKSDTTMVAWHGGLSRTAERALESFLYDNHNNMIPIEIINLDKLSNDVYSTNSNIHNTIAAKQ
jgi:hypothetical protein